MNESDIRSGAAWAKWFGIAKMLVGVYALYVMASVKDIPIADIWRFGPVDAIGQIAIGAVSFWLGITLLNSLTRKSSYFTTLIWIYSICLFLHVMNYLVMSSGEQRPVGQVVPILTVWALWKFVKGRRELRCSESDVAS